MKVKTDIKLLRVSSGASLIDSTLNYKRRKKYFLRKSQTTLSKTNVSVDYFENAISQTQTFSLTKSTLKTSSNSLNTFPSHSVFL